MGRKVHQCCSYVLTVVSVGYHLLASCFALQRGLLAPSHPLQVGGVAVFVMNEMVRNEWLSLLMEGSTLSNQTTSLLLLAGWVPRVDHYWLYNFVAPASNVFLYATGPSVQL